MRVGPTIRGYWRLARRSRLEDRDAVACDAALASAIVGGGILGLTAAYRLAAGRRRRRGVRARRRTSAASSARSTSTAHRVDRFYHVILPTDDRVRGLAEELGLGDRFRFRPTGVGFYDDGRLFSMSSLQASS